MKQLIALTLSMLTFLGTSAQFSKVTDIDDLALIYIGAQNRPDWNKELFRPYVEHVFSDSTSSWFFDGFIMLEFRRWNKDGVAVNLGESRAQPSTQQDWADMLDTQLGLDSDTGCKALDQLIGELLPKLGKPSHKHKVVMSIPLNNIKGDWYWGEIDGKTLTGNDRVKAMKWYIDLLLDSWNKAGFKNIELDGVYWTKEAYVANEDEDFKQITAYAKEKGLLNYWIPYRTALGRDKWRDWGIDVAYLQPNYYFKDERPMEWLDSSIDFAKKHGLGLELEFAGYDWSYNISTGERRLVPPGNIGLYDINPNYYQRLVDYINHFEQQDVFDTKPVAYYTGFQGIYDFVNSSNQRDRDIIDRLARIIKKRHIASKWIKGK